MANHSVFQKFKSNLNDQLPLVEEKKSCLENEASVPARGEVISKHAKCKHEEGGLRTDRGFQRLDTVSAGEAHWSQDGDALLGGQVAKRGSTHGGVTGGRPRIHHGGQSERFCKVCETNKVSEIFARPQTSPQTRRTCAFGQFTNLNLRLRMILGII